MSETHLTFDDSIPKPTTNVSFNVLQACEYGLAIPITKLSDRPWLEENRAALASSNSYVEAHGLPLAKQRPY